MQTAEIIRDDSLRELIPHKTGRAPFRYYEDDMTLFPGHTAAPSLARGIRDYDCQKGAGSVSDRRPSDPCERRRGDFYKFPDSSRPCRPRGRG